MTAPSEIIHTPQVNSLIYAFERYVTPERWNSYWHQVVEALQDNPLKVLVIGVGDGIVPLVLKSTGIEVKTLDIDVALQPDYVGHINDIDSIVNSNEFDVVLCCQVLEHLPFNVFETCINKLVKIARHKVVLSLPYNHRVLFYIAFKLPKISQKEYQITIPSFWQKWEFDGQHYWEIGTAGYPKKRIDKAISVIAPIRKCFVASGFRYHMFYVIDSYGGT